MENKITRIKIGGGSVVVDEELKRVTIESEIDMLKDIGRYSEIKLLLNSGTGKLESSVFRTNENYEYVNLPFIKNIILIDREHTYIQFICSNYETIKHNDLKFYVGRQRVFPDKIIGVLIPLSDKFLYLEDANTIKFTRACNLFCDTWTSDKIYEMILVPL